MSANERALKARVKSVRSLRKVTNAMYLIAYSSLSRRREAAAAADVVTRELTAALTPWLNSAPEREPDRKAPLVLLVFSGERGLAGDYYRLLGSAAERFLNSTPDSEAYRIGSVSVPVYGREVLPFPGFGEDSIPLSPAAVHRLTEQLLRRRQEQPAENIWILAADERQSGEPEAHPLRFFQPVKPENRHGPVFLTDSGTVKASAEQFYLNNQLSAFSLHASCAELKARMLSMHTATDNADDLLRTLQLQLQNVRQERITEELTELTAGASAHRKAVNREEKQ